MSDPSSAIPLSSNSEGERELARQLEEKRRVKAVRKVAQAAEAAHKAKEERAAAEKAAEEQQLAEEAEKAAEEAKQAEVAAGKKVARPMGVEAGAGGRPLMEPSTPCDACKAADTECVFCCGTRTSSCILCQEECKKPCVGATGLPDDIQCRIEHKDGAPKRKRRADESEPRSPCKKSKKTKVAEGSEKRPEVRLATPQPDSERDIRLAGLTNPDHVWAAYPAQLTAVELLHALLGEVQGLRRELAGYRAELEAGWAQRERAVAEAFFAWGQVAEDESLEDTAEFTEDSAEESKGLEGSDEAWEEGME
ncbi:hypothetical protein BC628DRAFT_1423022 [Trametes gibbosa]|nr:hypothetical protein BC628DRAFT_1423016 [Trametes gibbosa]KAI0820377.1 hypothetical protein BC628DRAFT_1423022 [Trametes gibbosa]